MIPTVVITTRGDVPLKPVLDSLPPEWPQIVWDNSQKQFDSKVFGYFDALREVQSDFVYTQADDAIIPARELHAFWNQDDHADQILLNVRDGDTPWISFGAIFHRDLPWPALNRYMDAYHDGQIHDDILKWCEVIFCELTPWENVDLGKQDLPHHTNPNRMEHQKDHYSEQARVRERARALRVTA